MNLRIVSMPRWKIRSWQEPHEEEADPAERVEAEKPLLVSAAPRARRAGSTSPPPWRRSRSARRTRRCRRRRGSTAARFAPITPERDARHHREGDAVAQRRPADQVHQEVDDQDADRHREQHLPAGEAEEEEAGGEGVAADRVDVRHPHREDVERFPGPAFGCRGRQIAVVERRVGAGISRTAVSPE